MARPWLLCGWLKDTVGRGRGAGWMTAIMMMMVVVMVVVTMMVLDVMAVS